MRHIESYELFDEYWRDVKIAFSGTDSNWFQPVHKRPHQNELALTFSRGGLEKAIRLVTRDRTPTSLQIREPDSSGIVRLTKLDVSLRPVPGEIEVAPFEGHLSIPRDNLVPMHGISIVTIEDVPEDSLPVIDESIQLLNDVYNKYLTRKVTV